MPLLTEEIKHRRMLEVIATELKINNAINMAIARNTLPEEDITALNKIIERRYAELTAQHQFENNSLSKK